MPSLKFLRGKIHSVESTSKITQAMQVVSSIRYKQAEKQWKSSKMLLESYGSVLFSLMSDSLFQMDDPNFCDFFTCTDQNKKDVLYVVVGPDRSLCGSFSSLSFRFFSEIIQSRTSDVFCIGKKVSQVFDARGAMHQVVQSLPLVHGSMSPFVYAQDIAARYTHILTSYRSVQFIFPVFTSLLEQEPCCRGFMPLVEKNVIYDQKLVCKSFISSRERNYTLGYVIPLYISSYFYAVMSEVSIGEHAARMVAMDSATRNCQKRVDEYKLEYNCARQALITREIIEIIAGTESL